MGARAPRDNTRTAHCMLQDSTPQPWASGLAAAKKTGCGRKKGLRRAPGPRKRLRPPPRLEWEMPRKPAA
ncbi:hypothetical protein NDU88_006474 [Pleurodeles waltl]|uniref:Uncharacterized protein n=1 Tax=Pleurodeles waltl TaxID=8319 RepID=A0AAV7TYF2_PLEWA|nr:hypothetical protein NDU88_006474 [Pleurodeles waltl]